MRIKSLLAVIVANVFLTLLASLFLEYANLEDRFRTVEDIFQVCLESAVVTATGSEEMFADNAMENAKLSSQASTGGHAAFSTTLLWRGGQWVQLNSYALAEYYSLHGQLPDAHAASLLYTGDTVQHYFEFLYGKAGTSYNASGLEWANTSRRMKSAYASLPSRVGGFNTDFYNFYRSIGYKQRTAGYVKIDDGAGSYVLGLRTYPVLYSMGFSWMSETVNNGGDPLTAGWTSDSTGVTADTFSSTMKAGKSKVGGVSTYYLTPMSLGVSYVPVEVLKPVMLANLETSVRLRRLNGVSALEMSQAGGGGAAAALNGADGCIGTSVYTSGGRKTHVSSSSERIVSDGDVEWDLNSLQVKVDYFYVDFINGSQSRAKTLISKLNGVISANEMYRNHAAGAGAYGASYYVGQSALANETLNRFKSQDSAKQTKDSAYVSLYNTVRGGRIIARVTARVKIHVPYKSSILQWFCERGGSPGHYSIKMWNGSNIERTNDGLWYTYTTYFMQSRV